jgi:hypothetical protein
VRWGEKLYSLQIAEAFINRQHSFQAIAKLLHVNVSFLLCFPSTHPCPNRFPMSICHVIATIENAACLPDRQPPFFHLFTDHLRAQVKLLHLSIAT